MSTGVPPPVQSGAPPNMGTAQPTVSVANPPPALASLPAGSTIAASVAEAGSGQQVVLATPEGALTVQTDIPLKAGQQLLLATLSRPPSASALLLQIVEVAGRPVSIAPPPPPAIPGALPASFLSQPPAIPGAGPAPGTPPAGSVNAAAPSSQVLLSTGQTVLAILLQGSDPAAAQALTSGLPGTATPAGIPKQALATGAVSRAPETGYAPASPGILNTPVRADGVPAPSTEAAASHGGRGAPGTPASAQAAQPGARLSLTIVSATPAVGVSPTPPAPGPLPRMGQTFSAVVTGTTPSGQPVVQTPIGRMAIEQAPPLAKGAELTFQLDSLIQPQTDSRPPLGPDARDQLALGGRWSTLADVLSAAEATPGLSDRLTHTMIPQPNHQLGATLLFLLSAFKAGDLKAWLGETGYRELARIRPDAMRRLGDDVRLLAGNSDDGRSHAARPSGDWRMVPLPLFGDGMTQSRLLVRRDPDGESGDKGRRRDETRFVVDLTMTSIGRLQLDGLVDVGARRFDMLIRTAGTLPPRFRGDVLEIFARANETIGLTGGLAFRATPDALIDTAELLASGKSTGLEV